MLKGAFMKKKICIILSIWLILSIAFGVYYTNSKPKPKKTFKPSPIKYEAKAAKEPFKSIGIEIVNIHLNKTQQNTAPFIKKMYEFGAEDVVITTEKNRSQVFKYLPTVFIGKEKYEKKKICTIVSYKYKGKKYQVGDCK